MGRHKVFKKHSLYAVIDIFKYRQIGKDRDNNHQKGDNRKKGVVAQRSRVIREFVLEKGREKVSDEDVVFFDELTYFYGFFHLFPLGCFRGIVYYFMLNIFFFF